MQDLFKNLTPLPICKQLPGQCFYSDTNFRGHIQYEIQKLLETALNYIVQYYSASMYRAISCARHQTSLDNI